MKELKVTMTVVVEDTEEAINAVKKWEHHIEHALDLDNYPEIKQVKDVHVQVDQ